jgi:hypothetical protein
MKKEFTQESLAAEKPTSNTRLQLVEGEDYHLENDLMVFTASFLLKRGYCCGNGCRRCPYPKEEVKVQRSMLEVSNP